MDTVRATVTSVVFSNDESGFKVLRTKNQAGKNLVITGEFGPEVVVETIADFHGDYSTHPKFGYQFKAKSCAIVHNAQEISSIQLFLDFIAPNIGKERSKAIVDLFGSETIEVLDKNPERLMEVDGIGEILTENIKKAWLENKEKWEDERIVYSLRAFLASLGLKEKRVKRILAFFDGCAYDAEKIILANPYCLIDVQSFGFSTVDFIARRLGVPEETPERLKAYIKFLLENTCPSDGHLFLTLPEILAYIQKFCADTNTKFLGTDITSFDVHSFVNELSKEEKLVYDNGKVYSKKQFNYESKSAARLVKIMNEKSDLIFLNKKAVDEHIEKFEHEHGFVLSNEQKEALYFFCDYKVFVLSGLPGSGKTTILKAIVQLALKMGLSLTCMTPTGISAKKLSSTVGYDAYTIHRRLGYHGLEWDHNENNPYDTDVAIVDESSMIDQEVFYRLLAAMKNRTHIIFVGDHNQLPSVGAGNVLRELINCAVVPTIKLEKIFRQSEVSDIKIASHRIIQGDTNLELFKEDPTSDIFFMRIKNISEIEKMVVKIAAKFKDEKREFQIITARNTGPLGIESLNNILQESLNSPAPHLNEIKFRDFILRRGDRVIVKKNDYENAIFNGDIGKVISMGAGKVCILIDERVVELTVDEIDEKIKLAYSLTVHRSQGQEYDYVILLFINQFGKNMLQRNLLYTALTRAKEKVIVLGHGSAIERAIENTSVTRRNTVLGERITQCWDQMKNPSSWELQEEQVSSLGVQPNTEPPLQETGKYYPMDLTGK